MSRVPSYYATPNRLKTPEQMQALLAERTKRTTSGAASSAASASDVSGAVEKQTTSAGGGCQPGLFDGSRTTSPARPASLQWLAPVKDSLTGHYTVKDTLGAYTVVAERTSGGKGWQYLAFKGSAVLAPVCNTAECAKAHCQADAEKFP